MKIIILLCCSYVALASEHSHPIPIHYEGQLQDLGQHVEYSHTPVKVVKITKTVAVKVPVPYPVKVVQKVPYPVHINKPYPVPVPQIVHVPATSHVQTKAIASGQHGGGAGDFIQQYNSQNSYSVQEPTSDGHVQNGHSFSIPSGGHGQSFSFLPSQHAETSYNNNEGQGHSFGGGHDQGSSGYDGGSQYAPSGSGDTDSYNQAINEYLQKHQQNGGNDYH